MPCCREAVWPSLVLGSVLVVALMRMHPLLLEVEHVPATAEPGPDGPPTVLVQVSDLHLSVFDSRRALLLDTLLDSVVGAVMPDALLITGDLTDTKFRLSDFGPRGPISREWDQYARAIRHVERRFPNMTVIDLPGNHDRFGQLRFWDASNPLHTHGASAARLRLLRGLPDAAPASSTVGEAFHSHHRHTQTVVEPRHIRFDQQQQQQQQDTAAAACARVRVVTVDATVDPAPTRHFFGRLTPKDIHTIDTLLAEPDQSSQGVPCSDVALVASHFPLNTIVFEPDAASTDVGPLQDIKLQLLDAYSRRRVRAALSGHLHQLPQGEGVVASPIGSQLHARLATGTLELELADLKIHGAFRVLVVTPQGEVVFTDSTLRLIAADPDELAHTLVHGGDHHHSHTIALKPIIVPVRPADARYLSPMDPILAPPSEAVAEVFAPGGLTSAHCAVSMPDGESAPWLLQRLAPGIVSHLEAIGWLTLSPGPARSSIMLGPASISTRQGSHRHTVRCVIPPEVIQALQTLPSEVDANGFAQLEFAATSGSGATSSLRIPISLRRKAPPLDWQRFVAGDMQAMVGQAATASLLLLAAAFAGGVFVARLRRRARGRSRTSPPGEAIRGPLEWMWGSVAAARERHPSMFMFLAAWTAYVYVGPWFIGQVVVGRWAALCAWGHVGPVLTPEDCSEVGERCFLSGLMWYMAHLDSPLYLVQMHALVAAPALALLGMDADQQHPDDGLRIVERSCGSWCGGRSSPPASITGLALLLIMLAGGLGLVALIGTHNGMSAAALSIGVGYPIAGIIAYCGALVVLDTWRSCAALVRSASRLHPKRE